MCARPLKEGLDYFPVDVRFDEKVEALESVFKNDGLAWIIKFWQTAYRTNDGEVSLGGYQGIIHAENSRVTLEKQKEIVKLCLEIGLLIKTKGNKYTSNGIKKRLDYIMNERKRWRVERKSIIIQADNPRDNIRETGESKVNKIYNNISQEIYLFYSKTIKPGAKEDSIRSITKLLKIGFNKDDLLGRINAYRQYLDKENKQDSTYYIQANNFFGRQARYKDFEPIKVVQYKPADPACKICKGTGKVLIENTGQVKICDCRIT